MCQRLSGRITGCGSCSRPASARISRSIEKRRTSRRLITFIRLLKQLEIFDAWSTLCMYTGSSKNRKCQNQIDLIQYTGLRAMTPHKSAFCMFTESSGFCYKRIENVRIRFVLSSKIPYNIVYNTDTRWPRWSGRGVMF